MSCSDSKKNTENVTTQNNPMAKEDANESVPSPLPSPSQIPSVLKTTKNNSIDSKRVSFSQAEDKENVFRPTLDGKRASRSATFGKANPLRDLGVFMAIIFFFFFVASSLQSFGKIDTGEEVIQNQGSLGRFRQMRNALSTMLQHELHQNPVRLDCDLLLTKSTIPRTGFGVFAGRNYTQGEPIMLLGYPSLSIETEQATRIWISPQSLLIKHHPTLSNIKSSQPLWTNVAPTSEDVPIVLEATKPITLGEELFFSFQQHLHSNLPEWFDQSIPKMEDYLEADFLIQEVRNTFRDPKGQRGRNADKQQKIGIVGSALRMVQRVVVRYRPAVAKLMPIALDALTNYRGRADQVTSLYLGLHNQTVNILTRYGLCISDVKENSLPHAVATRNVTKGMRVHPVPLLVRLKAESDSSQTCVSMDDISGSPGLCDNRKSLCWSRPETMVEFCPLQPLTNLKFVEPGAKDATVEIQWSNWTDAAKPADFDLLALQDKKRRLEVMFLWDFVATRDLNVGDELVISLERDDGTGQWLVPKELLSTKWIKKE